MGRIAVLFGANGVGKTTLLRILSTSVRPDAGTVRVAGRDLLRQTSEARRRIGVVGHRSFLYEDLTPRENLTYYARLYDVGDREMRVKAALERVGLSSRAGHRVRALSNGMQKRAAIARAILHQPDVLLLDEPEAGLDRDSRRMLGELLAEWTAEGRSVILTTHDVDLGLAWGNPRRRADRGPGDLPVQRRQWNTAGPVSIPVIRGGGVKGLLWPIATMVWKDIVLELRSRELVVSVIVFGLLLAVVFNFALRPSPGQAAALAPGILWVSFAFAATLAMNRAFVREQEAGALEGLLVSPVSRDAIFLAKAATSFIIHAAGGGRAAPGLRRDAAVLGPVVAVGGCHPAGNVGVCPDWHAVLGAGGSDPLQRNNAAGAVFPYHDAGHNRGCGGVTRRIGRRGHCGVGPLAAADWSFRCPFSGNMSVGIFIHSRGLTRFG